MKKNFYLILVFALSLSNISFSQFNPIWSDVYKHTPAQGFSNESRKIITDNSGNVFVLADVTSNIDPSGNTSPSTYHYVVLRKYNSSGNVINTTEIDIIDHQISGFNNYSAFGLETDSQGNIYIGYSYYEPSNDFDIYIRKYNNALSLVWEYTFKPSTKDLGVDMKLSSTGVVYAVVKSQVASDVTYHVISANAAGVSSTPLYTFDANLDQINSIILDANQNVYVTGSRLVSTFKNVLTASVDSLGNLRWKSVFNGGSSVRDDYGKSIAIGPGVIYVTGTSDRGLPRGNDVMTIKYADYNGKTYWQTYQDNGNGNDNGIFINVVGPNDLIVSSVTGNTAVIDRIVATSGLLSSRAIYEPVPASQYNTVDDLSIADVKISAGFNLYITGTILASDISGQTFSAAYLSRYHLDLAARGASAIKLEFEEEVSGEFIENFKSTAIAFDLTNDYVYWVRDVFFNYNNHLEESINITGYEVPAPFRFLNLSGNLNQEEHPKIIFSDNYLNVISVEHISSIEINDITGKTIQVITVNANSVSLNVNDLRAGLYFIRVSYSNNTYHNSIKGYVK
jgi:hypothetical protein